MGKCVVARFHTHIVAESNQVTHNVVCQRWNNVFVGEDPDMYKTIQTLEMVQLHMWNSLMVEPLIKGIERLSTHFL